MVLLGVAVAWFLNRTRRPRMRCLGHSEDRHRAEGLRAGGHRTDRRSQKRHRGFRGYRRSPRKLWVRLRRSVLRQVRRGRRDRKRHASRGRQVWRRLRLPL